MRFPDAGSSPVLLPIPDDRPRSLSELFAEWTRALLEAKPILVLGSECWTKEEQGWYWRFWFLYFRKMRWWSL